MSLVGYPEKFKVTPSTMQANRLLKQAGAGLKAVAKENSRLHEEVVKTQEKVSQLQKERHLTALALDAVEQGMLPVRQVRSKVSQWLKEGHSVDYYRALLDANSDRSFASVDGAVETTKQSGVDSATQNGETSAHDGLSPSSRIFHDELGSFLRQPN